MKPARLIVLFIAIAAGGIAALLAGRSDQPPSPPPAPAPVVQLETTDVLVAASDIGTGDLVGDQQLRWQTWPAEAANTSFIRKSERPDAVTELKGSMARVAMASGEPIRESKLIHGNGSGYLAAILPTGMRAVSIDISPERGVSGFILPNDHVDVLLTRHDKEAEKNSPGSEFLISETILTDVRVLAIGKTVEGKPGEHTVDGSVATLELTPAEAERLSLARQLGTMSLSLRSLVDAGRHDAARRSNAIVVYRGAESQTFICAPDCDHAGGAGTQVSTPSGTKSADAPK
jgi:pilus assembly protein CpaB